MTRSRLVLVVLLLTTLAAPAVAGAQAPSPLSPTFGDLQLLDGGPRHDTYYPRAASEGGTTAATWREGRIIVATRLDPAAGAAGARHELTRPGRVATGSEPVVAVTGNTVHVAWLDTGDGRLGIALATSRDGGRTFGAPRDVTPRTNDHLSEPRIAADGDTVFVAWEQTSSGQPTQLRTAGSRDGGRTFPCQARVSRVGDEPNRFDLAVDGDAVHWAWNSGKDRVVIRRSEDAGRTLAEPVEAASGFGTPRVVADGGKVVVVHGQDTTVTSSTDGGRTYGTQILSTESTKCPDHYCGDPYGADIDGERVVVAWIGRGGTHSATSADGGQTFRHVPLAPIIYTWHAFAQPEVAVEGRVVSIAWHGSPRTGTPEHPDYDLNPYVASSLDGGASYTISDADDEQPGQAIFPVAVANPDPAPAAGTIWWRTQGGIFTLRTIRYRGIALGAPDAEVVGATVTQGTEDPERLVAGRPTAVKVRVRSTYPRTVTVPVRITARYTAANGDEVTRTTEQDVPLRGGEVVTRHLKVDGVPEPGTLRVDAEVDPERTLGEADRENNVERVTRPVVAGRPLRILVVGVHATDEDAPACGAVQRVATGTRRYLAAAWPLDPRQLEVDAPCAADVAHAPGLTGSGFARMFTRLDRLIAGGDHDRVIGVVPAGWFSRQEVAEFRSAGGLAPFASTTRSMLLDARAQAGWVASHELAHELGWVAASAGETGHLDRVPAPGYWVSQDRAVTDRVDAMHPTGSLEELQDETARWTSPASWDFLVGALTTGGGPGLAAAAVADGPVLDVSGTVTPDGGTLASVQAGTGVAQDPDPDGALAVEQLDGAGQVVATHRFDASALYGALGVGTTEPPHDAIAEAPFSVRVARNADAVSFRLRRGADVLATRSRSAAAPEVAITAPAAGAVLSAGAETTVRWTASDADGDALRATVEISKDGASWIPVGTDVAGTELAVTIPNAFAGDTARVRVTTTDGWHGTTATSEPFSVRGGLVDGRIVTFDFVNGGERRGVWTANADGTDLKRVVENGVYPSWSPDGRRLAFSHGLPNTNTSVISTAAADGTGLRQISPGDDIHPKWMGARTVATRHNVPAGFDGFYDAKDQDTQEFTVRAGRYVEPCDLSADGTRALFLYNGYSVGNPDGTNLTALPPGYGPSVCGALSPDATKIIGFHNNELAIYDVATGTKTPFMVNTNAYDVHPQWSPTGEWIYWASSRSRAGFNFDIWRARPDGTGAQIVLDGDTNQNGQEESTDRSWYTVDVQPLQVGAPDPEPQGPSADAGGPYTVDEGAELTVDGSGTAAGDAAVESLRWDLDGDGAHDDATGQTATATFADDATLDVAVLATDAAGRTATDGAAVTVRNVAPVLHDVTVSTGTSGEVGVTARVTDAGAGDTHSATVDWKDGQGPQPASVLLDADGTTRVLATHPPLAVGAQVRLTVRDDDGATADVTATVAAAPANGAPTAGDAAADVPFATSVDVELPATDPEGDRLAVEVVAGPQHGRVVLPPSPTAGAPRVGYVPADDHVGEDAFTYRVRDASGGSQVATVRLRVQEPKAGEGPETDPVPAPTPTDPGSLPVDPAPVPGRPLEDSPPTGAGGGGPGGTPGSGGGAKPSARCVSRRSLTINVPAPRRGQRPHRKVTISVDGQVVTVRRGRRIAAPIDLRGLPKGRVKVTIAITRADGRTTRSARVYRTCVKRSASRQRSSARKGAR